MMTKMIFLSIISISFTAMHGMENEKYPLHEAAKNGNVVEARKLLKQGYDVNTSREYSETALHVALRVGNINMIRLLIEYKADVNAKYGFKREKITSIPILFGQHYCNLPKESTQYKKILTILVNNGADPKYRNTINQGTIFHDLYFWDNTWIKKHEDTVNELLKYITTELRVNINSQDISGNTALHLAARDGKSFMVEALVRHGANVHIRNLGHKPLDLLKETEIRNAKRIIPEWSNRNKEDNIAIYSTLKKAMLKQRQLLEK